MASWKHTCSQPRYYVGYVRLAHLVKIDASDEIIHYNLQWSKQAGAFVQNLQESPEGSPGARWHLRPCRSVL